MKSFKFIGCILLVCIAVSSVYALTQGLYEQLIYGLAISVAASIVIMYSCESFEEASAYLGRNMPPGVKGATLHAVGSSLPELLTTVFFLVLYSDIDGFSAGVATCAGSAIFNAVIIPALCVLAVMFVGVRGKNKKFKKIKYITVEKKTLLRDGFFVLVVGLTLVYFLKETTLTWWMGAFLLLIYAVYIGFLFLQVKKHKKINGKKTDDDYHHHSADIERGWFQAIIRFDFNHLFFGDQPLNVKRAWIVLLCSVCVIAAACFFLTEAVYMTSEGLGIAPYFAAVILAAAATSVPDTVLSVRDAIEGKFDDAVANAFGSNIFDIAVGLGLPLFLYGIIAGNVTLSPSLSGGSSAIQSLQIFLLIITTTVLLAFLLGKKFGLGKAIFLLFLYDLWILYVVGQALEIQWISHFFAYVGL